ncbi:hypothetical protein DPEC_G00080830 [Dallia pectoralis]|uniref:Uncharacterized protein n=1 Tax=Dallia pectoralis TaxID=75939 RepID=A0ACC2GYR7_DALPE|nr:hypothetical protein DPEC_G00080830 [Dallia pectoralis]
MMTRRTCLFYVQSLLAGGPLTWKLRSPLQTSQTQSTGPLRGLLGLRFPGTRNRTLWTYQELTTTTSFQMDDTTSARPGRCLATLDFEVTFLLILSPWMIGEKGRTRRRCRGERRIQKRRGGKWRRDKRRNRLRRVWRKGLDGSFERLAIIFMKTTFNSSYSTRETSYLSGCVSQLPSTTSCLPKMHLSSPIPEDRKDKGTQKNLLYFWGAALV